MALWDLGIIVLIILIILLFVFISLPLYFTGIVLDEDEGLLTAFGTTILLLISFSVCLSFFSWLGIGIVGLIIAIVVNLLIIKVIYDTFWDKAFIMWIVTIIMVVVITVVFGFLVSVSIWGLLALT